MINVVNINNHLFLGLLDLEGFSKEQEITVKRDLERAGTLFLLEHLFPGQPTELHYNEYRKPFLKGRTEHISISHSHDMLAVIVNTRESTGVDVELIREKVLNIKEKFLNATELAFAQRDIELLTILWAAKETIYKVHGRKGVEFSSHISVEPFEKESETLTASLRMPAEEKHYLLKKEKREDYILVYALHEI